MEPNNILELAMAEVIDDDDAAHHLVEFNSSKSRLIKQIQTEKNAVLLLAPIPSLRFLSPARIGATCALLRRNVIVHLSSVKLGRVVSKVNGNRFEDENRCGSWPQKSILLGLL